LLERDLQSCVRNGSEGCNTANGYDNLTGYHYESAMARLTNETTKEHLQLSKFNIQKALRIYSNVLGPSHPKTTGAATKLSVVSFKLEAIYLLIPLRAWING
jgi:hypothetical protein